MNRIKELRKSEGLTLRELGEDVGIAFGTLGNYENERRSPNIKSWQKLANHFGVDVLYLQGKSRYKNSDELFNKLALMSDENEKKLFINGLNSTELYMLTSNKNSPEHNDEIITAMNLLISNNQRQQKRLNKKLTEFRNNNIYTDIIWQLAKRNDSNIDENEPITDTYSDVFDLVYYLHLVRDNLSLVNLDKVDNAIAALQNLIGSNDVAISDDRKKYIDSYKSN